jgi:hypothetical protein
VRPQEGETSIGHEYWFADGVHGDRFDRSAITGGRRTRQGGTCLGISAGTMRNGWRTIFPSMGKAGKRSALPQHFHSLDETLIVGDGTPAFVFTRDSPARPYIQLFERRAVAGDGERYVGPKILAFDRSTFSNQHAHCFARFVRGGLRRMARQCCIRRI